MPFGCGGACAGGCTPSQGDASVQSRHSSQQAAPKVIVRRRDGADEAARATFLGGGSPTSATPSGRRQNARDARTVSPCRHDRPHGGCSNGHGGGDGVRPQARTDRPPHGTSQGQPVPSLSMPGWPGPVPVPATSVSPLQGTRPISERGVSRAPNAQDVAHFVRSPQDVVPQNPPRKSALAVCEEQNQYLKKNEQHLIKQKHRLEGQVRSMEARLSDLEAQKDQYKNLYEQARRASICRGGGDLEIDSLKEQLECVEHIKGLLTIENNSLTEQLKVAEQRTSDDCKKAACVICMDSLANVVCLPCKHLALCSYCAKENDVDACPICRASITEKMQIFTP
eukprot:TRINITY_DN76863_c0_g1_i1.p1 TRINITY_DN76863_c0_g1~~TRINITY_DN76863_c0_g1_i1.p1  ORF type:complete len:356 (-),score=39.50 TRINITY_DN76863_c0_g1_i1:153-1169(-)